MRVAPRCAGCKVLLPSVVSFRRSTRSIVCCPSLQTTPLETLDKHRLFSAQIPLSILIGYFKETFSSTNIIYNSLFLYGFYRKLQARVKPYTQVWLKREMAREGFYGCLPLLARSSAPENKARTHSSASIF